MQLAIFAATAGIHIRTMYSHSGPPRQIMVSMIAESELEMEDNGMTIYWAYGDQEDSVNGNEE